MLHCQSLCSFCFISLHGGNERMTSLGNTPVIVLVGPHGSGLRTQARLLADYFGSEARHAEIIDAESLLWSIEDNEPNDSRLVTLKTKIDWQAANLSGVLPDSVVNEAFRYLFESVTWKTDILIVVGPQSESQGFNIWTLFQENKSNLKIGIFLEVSIDACTCRLQKSLSAFGENRSPDVKARNLLRWWTKNRTVALSRCSNWFRPMKKIDGERKPNAVHRDIIYVLYGPAPKSERFSIIS